MLSLLPPTLLFPPSLSCTLLLMVQLTRPEPLVYCCTPSTCTAFLRHQLHNTPLEAVVAVPSAEGASSSDSGIPHPPGLPQPQVRRRVTGKQPPSEFEINMLTSLKQGILDINDYSINSGQSEDDQELQLLQDLRLQEWYQGDLQGYSEKEVKEAIKKELISLSSAGHEVFDPVPLNLLSSEDQAKIIELWWVIGPRSGQLKARFVGKGYTQIIDKESKYAHTTQATTLKVILLMSQIHRWSLCVSDVSSTRQLMNQRVSFIFRHLQKFNIQSWRFGDSGVSSMVSEIHWDHGKFIWIKFSKASISHKWSQTLALSQVWILQVILTSWSWHT